jgi:cytochrome b subunit of formate dehydrogenase
VAKLELRSMPALLALCGAAWLCAAAGAAGAQECAECHADVAVPAAPHGDLGCTGCHADVDPSSHPGATLPTPREAAICASCHEVAHALQGSVHAGVPCTGCHGPAHALTPVSDAASPMSPPNQVHACGACHASPPGLVEGYLGSVHARGLLKAGLVSAPSCSSCHGAHDVRRVSDPASATSWQRVPQTCGKCHERLLRTWESQSAHGLAWGRHETGGPVCTTCHSSHRVINPSIGTGRFKTPEGCGGCHGGRYSTYRDGFHGEATELGFLTAATCSDCHTPHRSLAASDPASTVNPANLQKTCGACHGAVNASFVTFDPHADPRETSVHPAVHLTWLFMTALLVGVFGFFAVHDLLWLQRSLVAALRGELAELRADGGPYVRRFSRLQVWMHVVVVTTFLVLAATGLPLKYHHSGWAKLLSGAMGGLGTTRVLHRIAAVVTFGYFAVHLGNLAVRVLVHRERGLFFGWKSMVPRPKDFGDLLRNVRYFLYLGPRPRFDRWTYWEKFDYFAVFWGVLIIGFSGLMLWFPALFTRLLPGWTLNAAFVVHSEEALLAVGFIFLFHFFHTDLRPESFPLDPVIFTGGMPLERFKAERPEEYERLSHRMELERHLIEAPTPAALRRWRIFGFVALTVGLSLAFAILWSTLFQGSAP